MRSILFFFAGLLLFMCTPDGAYSQVANGKLIGTVELSAQRVAQTSGPQSRYRRSTPTTNTSSDTRPVLVSIESTTIDPGADVSEIQRLDQNGLQFQPRLLGVKVGQKVRVINSDPVYHNVFSLSSVKRFDIGRRPRGDYVDVTFDKTGLVQVFCDIHPHMSANIVVLPENTFTWEVVSEKNTFTFSNLPDGRYRVHVFAPGFESYSAQFTINNGQSHTLGTVVLEES